MKFVIEIAVNEECQTVREVFHQATLMMEGFVRQGIPGEASLLRLITARPDQPYVILTEAMAEGNVAGDPVCSRMLLTRAPFDDAPLALAQARKELSTLTVQNTRDGSSIKVKL